MARKTGTAGNDRIDGTVFADTLLGLAGNDTLTGFDGNDTLKGGSGNDRLYGDDPSGNTIGMDKLFGGSGNDRLFGGFGNDTLKAGTGDDRLHAGSGSYDDWLTGGKGKDKFIFTEVGEPAPGAGGTVRITDFEMGADKLVMKFAGASFATLNIFQSTDGAVIESPLDNSGFIRLLGIEATNLSASDFIFA